MSTGRRQSVRQTEKRGVVVADSLPEEITEWFPGEMSSLYEREGRILAYSLAMVQSLARRLAAQAPEATLLEVPEADHFAMLSAPDQFERFLRDNLS